MAVLPSLEIAVRKKQKSYAEITVLQIHHYLHRDEIAFLFDPKGPGSRQTSKRGTVSCRAFDEARI